MKLLSWNLNYRRACIPRQIAAIAARAPDVVALQEVSVRSVEAFADAFERAGLRHAADSFSLSPGDRILRGPRRYGEMIISRFPLEVTPPGRFDLPWPERVLSAVVCLPGCPIELHTVHIPPGSSNGWIKIETLEGLFTGLAVESQRPRILCGDFNTPREESRDGTIVTWGQVVRSDGSIRIRRSIRGKPGARWDAAERSILSGLAAHDLHDIFRLLHGYETEAFSWELRRGALRKPRRFDHVFASRGLRPRSCRYLHDVRTAGLSDHAMIEAEFDLPLNMDQRRSV